MTSPPDLTSDAAPTEPGVPYRLERLGVIMEPDPDRPDEAEGTLNPATGRGADGRLRIFPRLVAEGNYSRVGRGLLRIVNGVPTGVDREGIALEPARSWESGTGHGGIEDPRITWIASLELHVMSYVAFGPLGPRPALAVSRDTERWSRLGPLQFEYEDALGTDLNLYPNKDVVLFPEIVPDPDGQPSYALLHRPMWDFSFTRPQEEAPLPHGTSDPRASIWISYVPALRAQADTAALARPAKHRALATPAFAWEALKIGAGPAPLRVQEGWLLIHHGVSGELAGGAFELQQNVRYAAGAMILDPADPSRVIARTSAPLLEPETADERSGAVANVVFPTAIEEIDGARYLFYGMADSRIGVARLDRIPPAAG